MRYFKTCILSLLTICFNATGQTSQTKKGAHVYTEAKYTDATGRSVVIQNSLPKGGGRYTHSSGKEFSYVIFWNRVVNEASTPLDLTINFRADSFTIFPSRNSYLKIFLPRDAMTINKDSLGDYGLTGLKSFLDTDFYKPARLRRTIYPGEECLFYIAMLFYQATGSARAELVLKEQDLFYRFNIGSRSALIPCGKIIFKY